MGVNQQGMALVTVVLLLATLMLLALTLTDKVVQSSRALNQEKLRQRTYWAASAGLERARHQLTRQYLQQNSWQTLLTAAHAGYPQEPFWTEEFAGIPVQVYLRDNFDGDEDPGQDQDLRVMLLVRAGKEGGPEVLLECLCGFDTVLPAAGSEPGTDIDLTTLFDTPVEAFALGE